MKTWKVVLLVFIAFFIWVWVWTSWSSTKNKEITNQRTEKNIENKKENNVKRSTLKEKCDQISNWDPIDKVKVILWEPSSTSETDMAWLWKMKYWIYSEGLKSCQIHFNSVDDVTTKSFVDL